MSNITGFSATGSTLWLYDLEQPGERLLRTASALVRLVASVTAAAVVLIGCGPAAPPAALAPASVAPPATVPASRTPSPSPTVSTTLAAGDTVLLIGDSQSEPSDSWPRRGLEAVGYDVHFCGLGGTGFVASNGETGNYVDALREGDWPLPAETPALIVIQGGGNDAARGATDEQIATNASALIAELTKRYPKTELAMIGTLGRGMNDGGGRRSEVDALLGRVAADHNLPFIAVGDWLTRYRQAGNLADAVHLLPAGHIALGQLLETRLRELHLDQG